MPYRFSARHFFGTFPQCDVKKEVALDRLVSTLPIEWALIAHELHADGTPHLHVVCRFSKVFTTTDSAAFDFIGGKHGNYQSARSIKRVLQYVRKDGDTCSHGEVPTSEDASVGSGRVAPSTRVAEMLLSGKSLMEVRAEEPGFYLTHKKHCRSLYAEVAAESSRQELMEWPGISLRLGAPSCEIKLNQWLAKNVLCDDRPFKQEQLYLHGPPNVGKTSLVNTLSQFLSVYFVPNDEDFYDGFIDGKYDLAVIDEFKAQKKITWMNTFLQGGPTPLRQKGSQYLKLQNIPVIILSNHSLDEAYNHSSGVALEALHSRLMEIEWTSKAFISVHLSVPEPSTPPTPVLPSTPPPRTPPSSPPPLKRTCRRVLDFDMDEEEPESQLPSL